MPSRTMKATKKLNLGIFGTLPQGRSRGVTAPVTKLTVRTPTPEDRKDWTKDGSIQTAVLLVDTASGQPKVLRLSEPAALGLLKGLLAVLPPLLLATDDEVCEAVEKMADAIQAASDDVEAAVRAVLEPTPLPAPTQETVPASMDPPEEEMGVDGRPLVEVLTEEGEDCPNPTSQDSSPPEPAPSESPASKGCYYPDLGDAPPADTTAVTSTAQDDPTFYPEPSAN